MEGKGKDEFLPFRSILAYESIQGVWHSQLFKKLMRMGKNEFLPFLPFPAFIFKTQQLWE